MIILVGIGFLIVSWTLDSIKVILNNIHSELVELNESKEIDEDE